MQRLRVGDLVQVIAGKDKGKRGKISKIAKGRERVVVEGLNMVMRHVKPNQRNTEGGRIQVEAAIHASNVMPVDAETDKPTRVKISVGDDGQKSRTSAAGNPLKQG
jgi:large subunit ribosomal protein L24